ncbi:MAG: hypothetical protein U0360_02990 [Dehalococcoidia bacterium]
MVAVDEQQIDARGGDGIGRTRPALQRERRDTGGGRTDVGEGRVEATDRDVGALEERPHLLEHHVEVAVRLEGRVRAAHGQDLSRRGDQHGVELARERAGVQGGSRGGVAQRVVAIDDQRKDVGRQRLGRHERDCTSFGAYRLDQLGQRTLARVEVGAAEGERVGDGASLPRGYVHLDGARRAPKLRPVTDAPREDPSQLLEAQLVDVTPRVDDGGPRPAVSGRGRRDAGGRRRRRGRSRGRGRRCGARGRSRRGGLGTLDLGATAEQQREHEDCEWSAHAASVTGARPTRPR